VAALDIRTFINVFSSSLLDFGIYLNATHFFLQGGNPYSAVFPQVYPPAFLFIITPFALLPIDIARILWTALSIANLVTALLILFKNLKPRVKLLLILAAFQLFPVKFTLGLGQINLFIFLGFVLIYHFLNQKNQFLAGLSLAIISFIKFNPILFLAYLFLTKNYKAILYCLGFFVLANLAIDLFTPHALNLSFIQATLFRVANPPLAYNNQSLPALLYRLNLSLFSLPLSAVIFAITSLSIFKNRQNTLRNFSLFMVTLLLISPIAWQHYLLWTIPAFYLLFSQKLNPKYLIYYLVIFFLINGNLKNSDLLLNFQLIYSHATFGLLLLYFSLLKTSPLSYLGNNDVGSRRPKGVRISK
jgi:alpha-1,2-mannosyltransferase